MTDRALARLSRAAGLEVDWTDAAGRPKRVSVEVQRAVLEALKLPCRSGSGIAESIAYLKEQRTPARAPKSGRAFLPEKTMWGVAVQLYALKGGTTKGFGDFAALQTFVRQAASCGADAVAISPVHALFGAEPSRDQPLCAFDAVVSEPALCALDAIRTVDRGKTGELATCDGREMGRAAERVRDIPARRSTVCIPRFCAKRRDAAFGPCPL